MKALNKIFILIALCFLSACVETIAVGTIAGGLLMTQEKKPADSASDAVISSRLVFDLAKNGLKNPANSVEVMVYEGRVLLAGIVRDAKKRGLAADLAWKINGVKEVIDKTESGESEALKFGDFGGLLRDYSVSAQVESRLLFSGDIASMNYKLTTVNGVVYFIGAASDEAELRKALNIAAKVRGVKKVVNYVVLANDKRNQ